MTAAAKGVYLLRDYDPNAEKMGNVFVQGSSSTFNLVSILPELEKQGINVRVSAVISEDLFRLQPSSYQASILPDGARYDSMFVTTMTKRVPQLANMGPLTEEYSLTADWGRPLAHGRVRSRRYRGVSPGRGIDSCGDHTVRAGP